MKSYEYFQETVESIADDSWAMTLKKHGNQGWMLCTINQEKTYKKRPFDGVADETMSEDSKMQTNYIVIFWREL